MVIIPAYSQIIKIENGLAVSAMSGSKLNFFENNINAFSSTIGYEYFEHKFFYLSSEIGYIRKGGKGRLSMDEVDGSSTLVTIKEAANYLHLNTTYRVRYLHKGFEIYLGIGPKIEFLIGSNQFQYKGFEHYKYNKYSFGLIPEIGLKKHINNNLLIGINLSYLYDFSHSAISEYDKINSKTSLLLISIGYLLQ